MLFNAQRFFAGFRTVRTVRTVRTRCPCPASALLSSVPEVKSTTQRQPGCSGFGTERYSHEDDSEFSRATWQMGAILMHMKRMLGATWLMLGAILMHTERQFL